MPAQIIATSAEVTPNGGLVRETFQIPSIQVQGMLVICPIDPVDCFAVWEHS